MSSATDFRVVRSPAIDNIHEILPKENDKQKTDKKVKEVACCIIL